jgi:phosphoenolpyruvate-protein phosphotransferase/dihydroxyacetone kinase phosphotransfer subunit
VVGIVVVSHSRALARAAVALADEMLHGARVRIEIAAGISGADDETFGTDATAIAAAVAAADGGDGVVVLMDLGSAVLSAELALDLLDGDVRNRVVLSPAPLVEGLVLAAVAAASGADRASVAREAAAALTAKAEHLGGSGATGDADSTAGPAGAATSSGSFVVTGEHGLHARPAARLVQLVSTLAADVELRNTTTSSAWVPAASLSRVAAIGARQGHEIDVRATATSAAAAVEAVRRVTDLASRLDDAPLAPTPADPGPATPRPATAPVPASPGIGIGPARPARAPDPADLSADLSAEAAEPAGAPAEEQARLAAALAAVGDDVRAVREHVARDAGPAEAAIFDAHLALLGDPELLRDAGSRVAAGAAAAPAWSAAVDTAAGALEALEDEYLRARAADVRDVGGQVLAHLRRGSAGSAATLDVLPAGAAGVLVAADLTPAQAATLDRERVAAVVLAYGSATAHSAILARARGIPAVVGAGAYVLDVAEGTPIAVDGGTGEVVVDPADDVVAAFRARADAQAGRHRDALRRAGTRAVTRDGVEVLVGANVGSPEDARAAAASGADLAGLVRTEFLFLGRSAAPDVDEQVAAYRALAEALGGRRLTLRTLDVGGDKPLGYVAQPAEANPFLGMRGIRLALDRPELFEDQLLAMAIVAQETPVGVMFPMVTTVAEVVVARHLLDRAVKRAGGTPPGLEVGIMVEVPAAALKAAAFAPLVDFFSIGTNDLTQYATAAERGNDAVGHVGDAYDPGVLRLVDAVCRAAGDRLVAVCGELAADEPAAALLVGLGVRELSVAPPAVPMVKDAVRAVDTSTAATLAADALTRPSADTVRDLLRQPPTRR